jgi:hypothetical protein
VYERADMDDKELDEFLGQLDASMFKKVEQFFMTVPRLKHEVKVTNPNTGKENDIVVEGLSSFFV